MRAPIHIMALSASLPAIAGCASTNDGVGLNNAEPIPALAAPAPSQPPEREPSLRGLDRSHWPAVVVTVPIDQVEHGFTLRSAWPFFGSGDPAPFPTALSALETEPGFPWSAGPRSGQRFRRGAPSSEISGIDALSGGEPDSNARTNSEDQP